MLTVEKDGDIFRTKTENSIDLISVRNVYDTWIASFQIPVYGEQELEC